VAEGGWGVKVVRIYDKGNFFHGVQGNKVSLQHRNRVHTSENPGLAHFGPLF